MLLFLTLLFASQSGILCQGSNISSENDTPVATCKKRIHRWSSRQCKLNSSLPGNVQFPPHTSCSRLTDWFVVGFSAPKQQLGLEVRRRGGLRINFNHLVGAFVFHKPAKTSHWLEGCKTQGAHNTWATPFAECFGFQLSVQCASTITAPRCTLKQCQWLDLPSAITQSVSTLTKVRFIRRHQRWALVHQKLRSSIHH